MLMLSRRVSEAIEITLPDQRIVKVTIMTLNGVRCGVGIDAPRDIQIRRTENLPQQPERRVQFR